MRKYWWPVCVFAVFVDCAPKASTKQKSEHKADASAQNPDSSATTPDAGSKPDGSSRPDSGASTRLTPIIETEAGPIQGEKQLDLLIYRGIPYAAPPTGDQRFKAPSPHTKWMATKETTEFGPACPQPTTTFNNPGKTSEDCLSLNVWSHDDKKRRAVMVWIHGGGFSIGASNLPLYEASQLARRGDVIVVSMNYRLGALGFLATAELINEHPNNTAGNYGILDQIAALQWVRDNIERFGGDPNRITVFGESAGAMSICALLAAPTARGLFQRAILQSGGGCYGLTGLSSPSPFGDRSALDLGQAIVAASGCPNTSGGLACLRGLTPAQIVAADNTQKSALFGLSETAPNKDGITIRDDSYNLYASGIGPEIEIIVGANADEMAFFFAELNMSKVLFENYVQQWFPQQAGALLALYPVANDAEAWAQYVSLWTDIAFVCPALAFSNILASQNISNYAYHFAHASIAPSLSRLGAFHSLELAYIFQRYTAFGFSPSNDDLSVSDDLILAWSTFAKTAVPQTSPRWPMYSSTMPAFAEFASTLTIRNELRKGRCKDLKQLYLTR